jgi:hypothetical protein
MVRVLVVGGLVLSLVAGVSSAQAASKGKKKADAAAQQAQAVAVPAATQVPQAAVVAAPEAPKVEVPAAPAPQIDKAKQEALAAKRALIERKRKELNNTEWDIELNASSGKEKKISDVLAFANNQVSCAGYVKKGFPVTNYTITVQDDGSLIIETMQTSEKSGTAFWRCELDPALQIMRGVLSLHTDDDKVISDYSFISINKKIITQSEK